MTPPHCHTATPLACQPVPSQAIRPRRRPFGSAISCQHGSDDAATLPPFLGIACQDVPDRDTWHVLARIVVVTLPTAGEPWQSPRLLLRRRIRGACERLG